MPKQLRQLPFFFTGLVVGVGGSRTDLFARVMDRSSVADRGLPTHASNMRGLLADLFKTSHAFVLTGTEDNAGRCNTVMTLSGLHDDYMTVKPQVGDEWFLPYAAIYGIAREGPGPVTIPVVYTTAFPHPKFSGD